MSKFGLLFAAKFWPSNFGDKVCVVKLLGIVFAKNVLLSNFDLEAKSWRHTTSIEQSFFMLFIYAIYLCYELDNIYNDTMVLLPLKLKPTASLQTL